MKKVQDALFALKPGHPDYEAVYKANKNFNGVVPAKDSDFDQTRRLMAKWLDEPFPGISTGPSAKPGRKRYGGRAYSLDDPVGRELLEVEVCGAAAA